MADFAPITYKITDSDLPYTLESLKFRVGDSLVFADGIEIHLNNSDFTDGIIELQTINSQGIESIIQLKIPSLVFDSEIRTIEDFNAIFGASSLTYYPAITDIELDNNQIHLEGTVGPGIDEVIIYAQRGSDLKIELGRTDVTDGKWQYTVDNLDSGQYTFYVIEILADGTEGNSSNLETLSITDELILTTSSDTVFEDPGEPSTVIFNLQGNSNSVININLSDNNQVDLNEIEWIGLDTNQQMILDSEGQGSFRIKILSDTLNENNELLQITVTETLSDGRVHSVTNQIEVIDVLPEFTITTDFSEVYEPPENPNTVTYTLNGVPFSLVTLSFAPNNEVDNSDIESTTLGPENNTITLDENGQAIFSVTLQEDRFTEGDEWLHLIATETLTDGATRNNLASVKIIDVLPALKLTSDLNDVFEQPGTPNTITYTITGSPNTSVELFINANSIAKASDILSSNLPDNNRLTLNDQGEAQFTITTLADDLDESSEELQITVSQVDNESNQDTVSVVIHDLLPVNLTVDVKEIYEQPGLPNVAIYTLTGSPTAEIELTLSGLSQAKANDIVTTNWPNNNRLILDENGKAQFTVSALADGLNETRETLSITASQVGNPSRQAITNITIIDLLPLRLTTNLKDLFEQPGTPNTVTYTVFGSPNTEVELFIDPTSEAQAEDILSTNLPENNRLTLDAQGQAQFTVTTLADDLDEVSEAFIVNALQIGNSSNQATTSITIRDLLPLTLVTDTTEVFEQPGTPSQINYTVTGSPNTQVELFIDAASEAQAEDILSTNLPNNNRLTLNAQGEAQFSVTTLADDQDEVSETFQVTAVQVGYSQNQATTSITIRDLLPLTLVTDTTEVFEQPGTPSQINYTVTGSPNTEVELFIDTTSKAQAEDILSTNLPSNNRLTLNGQGEAQFSVTTLADDLDEVSEAFIVNAVQVGNSSNQTTTSVTIRDLLPLTLVTNVVEVFEQPGTPSQINYTVTGSPNTEIELFIDATSAAQAEDILSTNLPNNNRLTLNDQGEAQFSVTTLADDLDEISEAFIVNAVQVGNSSNQITTSVTIRDLLPLTLVADVVEVFEQPGTPSKINYTVTGSPNTEVELFIDDNSIAQASDILSTNLPDNNRLLLDANGEAQFTITPLADNLNEVSEVLMVTAIQVGNSSNQITSSVTILEVPPPPPTPITPLRITADVTEIFESPGTPDGVIYTVTGEPGTEFSLNIDFGNVTRELFSEEGGSPLLDSSGQTELLFISTGSSDNTLQGSEILQITVTDNANSSNSSSISTLISDTWVLTTGTDTLIGGNSNDYFYAPLVDGVSTLNSGEVIDALNGGLGNDIFKAIFPLGTYIPDLTDIETLTVSGDGRVADPGNILLNLSYSVGLNQINAQNRVTVYDGTFDFNTVTINLNDAFLEISGDYSPTDAQLNYSSSGISQLIATQAEILIDMSSQSESITLNSNALAELIGGSGDDYFIISNNDNSWVNGNSGWDTLWISENYSPSSDDSLIGIEKIIFQSTNNQTLDLGSQSEDFVIELDSSGEQIALGSGSNDIYLSSSFNSSSISNFKLNTDRIYLSQDVFSALPINFTVDNLISADSPVPSDNNDFLLYNTSTGWLSYDADGSGNISAVDILQFMGIPNITITDFLVY